MNVQAITKSERSIWSSLAWLLSNGPAIVTVLGSATIAIVSSVVDLSQVHFFQAILALLALIGTSLVTEKLMEGRFLRNQLKNIDSRLEQVLANENVGLDSLVVSRRDLPPLETRLIGAKRIAISGGSLFRLVNEYKNLFEQLAQGGCQLRFIMTDPDTDAAEFLSAAVSYESNSVDAYRAHMRDALTGLSMLVQRFPHSCQLRLSTVAPPFSLVMVERDATKSTIQVELYPFSIPARDRPIFLLNQEEDPRLFNFFSSQFETLWNAKFSRSHDQASPS